MFGVFNLRLGSGFCGIVFYPAEQQKIIYNLTGQCVFQHVINRYGFCSGIVKSRVK